MSVQKPSGLSLQAAKLVADEVRKSGQYSHCKVNITLCSAVSELYAVKVWDRGELVLKFDGSKG